MTSISITSYTLHTPLPPWHFLTDKLICSAHANFLVFTKVSLDNACTCVF